MKTLKVTKVPKQFGWTDYHGLVEMCDNTDNYTERQCLIIADVVSVDVKVIPLQDVMTDAEFEKIFLTDKPLNVCGQI